jgi:hypothetical protein
MANTQTMSLRQIEKSTGLPKKVLNYMKNDLIGPALINKYAAVLYILSQGYNALDTTFSFEGKPQYTVDDKLYDYVKNVVARSIFGYQK